MKLLLDTHALVWWLNDNPKLSAVARAAIADPGNDVFVSARTIVTRVRSHVTDVLAGRVEWLLRPSETGFSIRMKRTDLLHSEEPLPALTFLL